MWERCSETQRGVRYGAPLLLPLSWIMKIRRSPLPVGSHMWLSIASMFSGMPLNSVNHLPKQLTEETRLEPNLNTLRDPAGPVRPDAIPLGGLSFQYIFEMR